MKYKWDNANEWLRNCSIPAEEILIAIMDQLDSDMIQDVFQSEMEEDGYFVPGEAKVFTIWWQPEDPEDEAQEIDETADPAEAASMIVNYTMAYRGRVWSDPALPD